MEDRRSGKRPAKFFINRAAAKCGCREGGFTLIELPVVSKCKSPAFTLVELLVVVAILVLLLAMLVPSLSAVRRKARLSACAVQMRGVGVAIRQFAAANRNRLPPFAFSDHYGNLPLSGHWGGQSQPGDPDCFGRRGTENVNLWRLIADGYIQPGQLICPGADGSLAAGRSSYFPYTSRFSTYCLRMPYSQDLFRTAPSLRNWGGRGLLGIYTGYAGGERVRVGMNLLTVPLVRLDLTYRETEPAAGEQRTVDFFGGAIMSDTFWYQDHHREAAPAPPLTTYGVRAGWCHGEQFNVLFGDGAVRAIGDDGTVAANSVAPEAPLADDGANFASYAIRVWRYFEDNR